MIAFVLLAALVVTAAITDAARHRIYNWTTYPGMLAGIALAALGWCWEAAAPESAAAWRPWIGWLAMSDAIAGFLVCGLLMVVCFVVFPIGGGDVKLLAMVGAMAGLEKGLEVLLWAFIIGGCVGLVVLVWKFGVLKLLSRGLQLAVGLLSLGTLFRGPREEQETLKLPIFLGPCVAAALIAAFVRVPFVQMPWPM
ncbi:MAG: A24 family peptidase [Planctomycetaceae bacterium]|nr:A24 family peptidase [Planctomycetaceae bacterium]